jgi:DNA-damage-inducible protein D
MGSEELGANLFRITQTEAAIKKNGIKTPSEASATHYKIGKAIRKTIEELGGTMPEELPTPDKSIGQIEKEQRILLKEQKSNKNDE